MCGVVKRVDTMLPVYGGLRAPIRQRHHCWRQTLAARGSFTPAQRRFRCAEVLFLAETHELVDGEPIIVEAKRFRCADGLFPSRFYFNVVPSRPESSTRPSMKRVIDFCKDVYAHVVLTGGSAILWSAPNTSLRQASAGFCVFYC